MQYASSAIALEMGTASSDFPMDAPKNDGMDYGAGMCWSNQDESCSVSKWAISDSTSGGVLSAVFADSIIRLSEFRHLPSNWDSYGAMPISEEAIAASKDFFAFLQSKLPDLAECLWYEQRYALAPVATVPLDDGGVGIEWSLPNMEIEISIGPDRKIECLAVEGTGENRKYFEYDKVSKEEILTLFLKALVS